MSKKKPTHIYIVWWRDAYQENSAVELDDIEECDWINVTTGFFIKEDKHYLTMAQEFTPHCDEYENITRIPHAMVLRKRKWKIPYKEDK